MLNILNVTHDGKIYFSTNEEIDDITLKVRDRKYDSEVYIKHYEKLL